MLASDDSDDEPDYAQQEQEKVDETYKKIKKGKIKFNTSTLDEHGNWRASGELRKKKQGKGWKVRYCHIVSLEMSHAAPSCHCYTQLSLPEPFPWGRTEAGHRAAIKRHHLRQKNLTHLALVPAGGATVLVRGYQKVFDKQG